ncbi:HNH endonuclease [Aquimarina muelleri]|uniref:HNH endonuclease n=1 Tax=Aquimarina muelleri TaxID=279356 RepID=A0A918N4X0_9FLAO|nr:HNH endonuclease [Aquimarina muelleri]GGX33546.1 hypothetical protein GCM10007384_37780 [Aquimarina muelleri]
MTLNKKEYIRKGKCIWCLKSKPEVEFYTKPHTIPKKLNSHNIGFDICDSCNSFFGSDNKLDKVTYSVDKVLKEFFNVHKFLLNNKKDSNSWKKFKSQFFNYYHTSKTLKLKIDYRRNATYINQLTRKFKRGIYNIFLQEYHRNTENGLDNKFDKIREFVRYDIGELPLYYLKNSNGVKMTEDLDLSHGLPFNGYLIEILDKYGFYHLSMIGLNFYLEATEKAKLNLDYLIKDSNHLIGTGFVFKELIELKKLNEIDFTLRNWD